MACKRFKSEDCNAEVGDGTGQVDIISQLEGVSHVLEEIFFHVDVATVCESVKVSTTWKRLINSLGVFVWKKNLKMSPTWRTLAVRMEHLQPQLWDRMNKGDASSYREACRYVEDNIRQISQSATKNFNFKAVHKGEATFIRMNDKYVFFGARSKVVILNRWTRQPVKDFVCCGGVYNMQLNERFLVVQLTDEMVIYDVQRLERIQTLGRREPHYRMIFGLGSDVIFIGEPHYNAKFGLGSVVNFIGKPPFLWQQPNDYKFEVHRWNASAARFVRDTETEDRLKVIDAYNAFMYIYVDDKYLILDFDIGVDNSRLIKVFSLETMQLLRERKFDFMLSKRIRKEYHDGGIVVRTLPTDGQPSCVALWDVDKDTVQPISDHPNQFFHSFTMTHHPFQIVVEEREDHDQLLLVQRGQPTGNSFIDMPSRLCVPQDLLNHNGMCFDGVQMIAQSYGESIRLMMADLVG